MGVTIYESCRHDQIWIKHGRMMAEWVKYGCNLYGGWKTRSNSVVTFMEEYRHVQIWMLHGRKMAEMLDFDILSTQVGK